MKKRDQFFDIAKGVGIISVVIGHCFPLAMRFVYSYHLLLFFFIAGYFYNKEKYEDDPFGNIVSKLKSNYFKYLFFSLLILFLHNFFFSLGVLDSYKYSLSELAKHAINLTMFIPNDSIAGALWFIPVMIYAVGLFGVIVYFGNRFKKETHSYIFTAFICFLLGVFGLYINERMLFLFQHVQTSILVMPVIFAGYSLAFAKKKNIFDFEKYLKWYGFIISTVLFLIILKLYPSLFIELSKNFIISKKVFFILGFTGIYMALSFSKIITNTKFLSRHFAWIGKYSFEIMALHFIIFKMIDYIYYNFNQAINLKAFPISDINIWYIYLVLGTYGSIFLAKLIYYFKDKIFNFFNILKKKEIIK